MVTKPRFESLVATLPQTVHEVIARTSQLSSPLRGMFAARLAVQFREDPGLKSLIKQLLYTELLPADIPVQTEAVDKVPTDDWDLVSNVATLTLPVPQTNACKNLLTRTIGISMACAIKDEELLREISNHPSETMKSRAKQSLNALIAARNPAPVVLRDPLAEFNNYFDAVSAAPLKVPPGSTVKTRNQLWEDFGAPDWNMSGWANGSLKSILDLSLRHTIANLILTLMMEHPPVEFVKNKSIPVMPTLLVKNLKDLTRYDAQRTIAAICTTISKESSRNAESSVLPPLFQRKVNLWSSNRYQDKVSLLKPILESVRSVQDPKKPNPFNHKLLGTILVARPTSDVVYHLLDLAFADANLIIKKYIETLTEDPSSKNVLSNTRSFVSEMSSAFSYILTIVSEIHKRVLATGSREDKVEPQALFETAVMGTVNKLLTLFEATMEALPTEKDSRVNNPKDLFDEFLAKRDYYKRSWLFVPLLSSFESHPKLALHVYNSIKHELTSQDLKVADRVLACLTSVTPSVFDFPSNGLIPKYSGIDRAGPFNEEAFNQFISLFPIIENRNFWLAVTSRLSKVQQMILKRAFSLPELAKLDGYTMCSVLDALFLDKAERGDMALKLMAGVKGNQDLSAPIILANVSLLRQRLYICAPEVRHMLEENLRQPSIELRVNAIKEYLVVSNSASDIDETIATLSSIFPKIKNEMRLNMDQIFNMVNATRSPTFFAGYSVEQAKKIVPVYEALNENNLSSVSLSPPLNYFIRTLAEDMIAYYVATPKHPFFQFGLDALWAIQIHQSGASPDVHLNHRFVNPKYDRTREDLEIQFRKSIARGLELTARVVPKGADVIQGWGLPNGPFGLFLVPEGQEEAIVSQIVDKLQSKYLTVVDESSPSVAFEDSNCGTVLFKSLRDVLGLRWASSATLVTYFERCFAQLEKAPTRVHGSESVLDWTGVREVAALNFVSQSSKWAGSEYSLRLSELTLKSTNAASEASVLFHRCETVADKEAVIDRLFQLSPSGSALHHQWVMEYVLENLPHLLKSEHFSEKRAFLGLFNNSTDARLAFVLSSKSEISPLPGDTLLPWQAELLMKRYQEEALDKKLPMNDRVMAISRFMHMPNVSVNDVAAFLVSDSLPPRIKEAVLMFLPKLDEPASTLNLLVLPVYLQSDLARTAIFGVKNVLSYMPQERLVQVLQNLIPAENGKGVKVGVFKEITRLVGEYCYLPEVLRILGALWERKNLHKDVRIALLQKVVTLLGDRNKEISELAWKIVVDCVNGDFFEESGMVLVMSKNETPVEYSQAVTIQGNVSAWYLYGDLSVAVIGNAQSGRFAREVIIPMALRLLNHLKQLPKNHETYMDLLNRMKYAFMNISTGGFLNKENAHEISVMLAPLFQQATAASPRDLEDELFYPLATMMGQCTGILGETKGQTEVPFAWHQIAESAQSLASTFLDLKNPATLRLLAKLKLDKLNFGSNFIPKAEIHCQALVKATMLPICVMEENVVNAGKYFEDIKYLREIQLLRRTASLVLKFPTTTNKPGPFDAFIPFILETAEHMFVRMVRNGFEASEFGSGELDKSTFESRFRQVCIDCEKILGFQRNCMGFMIRMSGVPRSLALTHIEASFVESLVYSDDPCLERIWSQLANHYHDLLNPLRQSFERHEAWKEAGYGKEPKHDQASLDKLFTLLRFIKACPLATKETQSMYKFMRQVLDGSTVFLLDFAVDFILKDTSSSKRLQSVWIRHLSNAFSRLDRKILEHPAYGIDVVRPILSQIVADARRVSFGTDKKETERFEDLISGNLGLLLHICPDAAEYIVEKPWSTSGAAVINHISDVYGPDVVCMYLEALLDNRVGDIDIAGLVQLDSFSASYTDKYFALKVEEQVSSKDPLIQTDISRQRRVERFGSVEKAAQYFVDSRSNMNAIAFKSFSKYLDNRVESTVNGGFAESLVRIGGSASEPPKEVVAFVADRLTLELALYNPYLYFKWLSLTISHLEPFEIPQWTSKFTLTLLQSSSRDNTLDEKGNTFGKAIPIQYLLDIVSTLVYKVIPQYDTAKEYRVASGLRSVALKILQGIHQKTYQSCFAKGRKETHSLNDLVVLEAAEAVGREGEMEIKGFQKLVADLMVHGNRSVFDAACQLQSSDWQLKWNTDELK
ncbi:UNVERIFIED_CONTAM: hypothetical protein HDU68_011703 [Siphonaria sp. JEL0065]|nr:hypothetical protein HDU68_011703 [Siphonaria sp. JEL0065]